MTSTETLSCTSATNSTGLDVAIGYWNSFSSMGFSVRGNTSGTPLSVSMNYTVVYDSSTTYKVNVDYLNGTVLTAVTIWVDKSGNVQALYMDGHNHTRSATVTSRVDSLLAPIATYSQFASEVTSSMSYFRATGTSTVTIGTNTFEVTNYTTNTPSVSIESCSGVSYLLSKYVLLVGTPTGSSSQIMPYMEIAGSITTVSTSGQVTIPFEFTVQITELTLA